MEAAGRKVPNDFEKSFFLWFRVLEIQLFARNTEPARKFDDLSEGGPYPIDARGCDRAKTFGIYYLIALQ